MRKKSVLLALILLAGVASTRSESAPDYERYRRETRERFLVRIEKVKLVRVVHEKNDHEVAYARARVIKVMRTTSGVSSGDTIFIRYIHRFISRSGSTIPVVREGSVYTAYLNRILGRLPEDEKVLPGWDFHRQFFPCVEQWSFVEYPAW